MIQTILLLLTLLINVGILLYLVKISYNTKLSISGIKIALTGQGNIIKIIRTRLDFNKICLQYCLLCIRPYIIAIMNQASEREDYEEAETCKTILQEVDRLINFNPDKNEDKQ